MEVSRGQVGMGAARDWWRAWEIESSVAWVGSREEGMVFSSQMAAEWSPFLVGPMCGMLPREVTVWL